MSKIFGIEWSRHPAPPPPPPPWRADFRRREELPDMKVVRTDFLLNYVTAAVALGLVALAVWNEHQYADLRSEIASYTAGIAARTAAENALLKQSGVWSESAKVVDAYTLFRRNPSDCARLLAEIGSIKNPGMTVKTLAVDTAYVAPGAKPTVPKEIRVTVVGTQKLDDVAKSFAEVGESYRKFRELKIWSEIPGGKIKAEPSPTRVVSNLQNHVIEFTFELSIEGAAR